MRKLYLHIGIEKTGTTSLQYFLSENRERLAKLGCWIPGCIMQKNHFKIAVCCYDEFRNDDLCRYLGIESENDWEQQKQQIIYQLSEEIASCSCAFGIISSENFQSRLHTVSERNRLRDLFIKLGFTDVTVILYLRDPASLANSHYFTDVGQGYVGRLPGRPDDHYFKNLCDHRATIQNWRSVFKECQFVVRLYDADGNGRFSTIDDFLKLIPELKGQKLKSVKNGNVSISALGIELIRRINEIEPFWVGGEVNPVRRGMNHHIRKRYQSKRYGMPSWLSHEYDTAFADSNEWVRQNYFPDRTSLFLRKEIRESLLEMPESEIQLEANKVLDMLRRRYSRKVWRKQIRIKIKGFLSKFSNAITD
jgi:hypothetical protein